MQKVKKLKYLEYVTLLDIHKEEWYGRVKKYFIRFMLFTTIICSLEAIALSLQYPMICIVLIGIFIINIFILKCIDEDYLHRMAIRFWYSEWGYCLYYPSSCKFVGAVQLIELGKNNKYIYALLDYIAFIRVIYTEDEFNDDENIKVISKNLTMLYKEYEDEKEINWLKVLPLWIIAFYENLLYKDIKGETKEQLQKSIKNKDEWKYINIFMQSLVVDLFRRMPNDKDKKLVYDFMGKIKNYHI